MYFIHSQWSNSLVVGFGTVAAEISKIILLINIFQKPLHIINRFIKVTLYFQIKKGDCIVCH